MKARIDASAVTDAGPFRKNNEDVVLARADLGLFVVADGVGGRPLGERAAALAAELFASICGKKRPSADALLDAFQSVNDALHMESNDRHLSSPMAAVATVAWLDTAGEEARVLIGHIGDTRAHLFDADGAGCQLTHDQAAIDADAVPESETLGAPGRNVVASALGLAPWSDDECREHVELRELSLQRGQTLVLISDGVSDYVDRARLSAVVLERGRSAKQLARALLAAAIEAQTTARSGDNIGVVVVRRGRTAKSRIPGLAGDRTPRSGLRVFGAVGAGMMLGLLAAGAIADTKHPAPLPASPAPRELTLSLENRALESVAITVDAGRKITIANGEAVCMRIVLASGAEIELVPGEPVSMPAGGSR